MKQRIPESNPEFQKIMGDFGAVQETTGVSCKVYESKRKCNSGPDIYNFMEKNIIDRIKWTFLFYSFFIMGCSKTGSHRETKVLPNPDNVVIKENLLSLKKSLRKLQSQFGLESNQFAILVSISKQKLHLIKNAEIIKTYPISTSKYGIGNKKGSHKTPLGMHRISEKEGEGAEIGAIFRWCRNTGKIAKIYTDNTDIPKDLITTRIMRLKGLELAINKGKGIDSYKRGIFIHGTPEEGLIGKPASHGCVRMKNKDVIELFNLVPVGTLVEIQE